MVSRELVRIESFFCRCITAEQTVGTMTSQQSAAALSKMLLSVLLGIRVLSRIRPQRSVFEAAAASAIASLSV
jgi:TetR/AcrR family transcriptional repressor of nem operon